MSTAFDVVFGIFVVMILAVAFLSVRWAIQRDRAGRTARAGQSGDRGPGSEPPASEPRVSPGRSGGEDSR
jgi:hypothetical protein